VIIYLRHPDLDLWDALNKKPKEAPRALWLISSTLDPSIHTLLPKLLEDFTSAVELWEILENRYKETIGRQDKSEALDQVLSFCYPGPDVDSVLEAHRQMASIAFRLGQVYGGSIEEQTITISEMLQAMLLRKLPYEFKNKRTQLEGLKELLTLENLMKEIALEAKAQGHQRPAKPSSGALKSAANGKCKHNRSGTSCHKCYPELAPLCKECQALGFHLFRHNANPAIHESNMKIVAKARENAGA
jgi:hypothetical protein